MNNFTTNTYEMKREILNFSKNLNWKSKTSLYKLVFF